VVCLRAILPADWIARLQDGVEAWLASPDAIDMTGYGRHIAQGLAPERAADLATHDGRTGPGRFQSGTDSWRALPVFADFAIASPLPGIVAALLRSPTLHLYEDSILVKEPGTVERTAFHQDIAYFHVEGSQICTSWVPLDPVTQHTGGLQFIRASHLWKAQYRPNHFVSRLALEGTEGEDVPDFHKDRRGQEILTFDTVPGDITIHHARTIHGAPGNASATLRRRAVSVRYCGADARYRIRRGAPLKPHQAAVADGDPLGGPDCPQVWPRISPQV
jgi:ectoine hydroxylase-related dioxygenase (phytanoyl-CoA dioxygenase family)